MTTYACPACKRDEHLILRDLHITGGFRVDRGGYFVVDADLSRAATAVLTCTRCGAQGRPHTFKVKESERAQNVPQEARQAGVPKATRKGGTFFPNKAQPAPRPRRTAP